VSIPRGSYKQNVEEFENLTFAPPGGRFTISTTRTLRSGVETVTGYETHHTPDRTVNRISSYDDRSKFAFFAPTRHLADDFRTNEDLGRQRPTTCTGPPSGGKIGVKRPNGTRLKNRESAISGLRVTLGRKRLTRSRVAFTPTTLSVVRSR
jgi:hypothetical protein